jgi:hypothetical protein
MRKYFKLLEGKRGEYCNVRNVNYFLSNIHLVQNHLRSCKNITIPANHENCYNKQKYLVWNIMKDVKNTHGKEIINNPHLDK